MLTLPLLLALACQAPQDPTLVQPADAEAAYGAARTHLRAAGRTGRPYAVEVSFPIDGDEPILSSDTPFPAVVLVQGGAVDHRRYLWLADALARGGFVVITPAYPADLAIFAGRRSDRALNRVRTLAEGDDPVLRGALDDAPAAVMGHSLGGVVAAMRWAKQEDRYGPLALLASYPADGTDVEGQDRPVFSLTGSADGRSEFADVEAGWSRFGGPSALGVIDGMNHMDWADDATEAELADDGPPAPNQPAARALAVTALTTWLDHTQRGGAPLSESPGITLEMRP